MDSIILTFIRSPKAAQNYIIYKKKRKFVSDWVHLGLNLRISSYIRKPLIWLCTQSLPNFPHKGNFSHFFIIVCITGKERRTRTTYLKEGLFLWPLPNIYIDSSLVKCFNRVYVRFESRESTLYNPVSYEFNEWGQIYGIICRLCTYHDFWSNYNLLQQFL